MPVDDSAADRQSDPATLNVLFDTQSFENREYPVPVGILNPDPVVANRYFPKLSLTATRNVNLGSLFSTILDRIFDQVVKQHDELLSITEDIR
jgi:hypothetical protein